MKQSLPWESVPPPIYPALSSLKPRKKWVQTGGWILVVVLLLFGISTRSRNPLLAFVSLAFSVLYLLTLMTKKDAALTSRGLEIFYNMQFTTNYEFFPWEDINAIVCEDRGHADMVRLHIGHGNTEKALFFPARRPRRDLRVHQKEESGDPHHGLCRARTEVQQEAQEVNNCDLSTKNEGRPAFAGRFFYLFCPILSLYPDSVLSKYGDNAQQRKLFPAKNY